MRRLIFILLAMIGVSQAQTIQYIGAPTTTVISRGNFRTDSIFYLPKRSKAPTDTAAFRYQISDSSLYVWTGSQWIKAGEIDTTTISTRAWRQKGIDSLAAIRIAGSGTTNYIPKFTASGTIGNSRIIDSVTKGGIGTQPSVSEDVSFWVVKTSSNGVARGLQSYVNFSGNYGATAFDGVVNVNSSTNYDHIAVNQNLFKIEGSAVASTGVHGIVSEGIYNGTSTTSIGSLLKLGNISGTGTITDKYAIYQTSTLKSYMANNLISNGKICIGCSASASPAFALTVNATSNPIIELQNNASTFAYVGLASSLFSGGSNGLGITVGAGNKIILGADGTRYATFESSGEVFINTTSDAGDYKLQVSGNIYNTGSITTGAPSGGSIKPWKIGEAATVSPTSPNRTIRVEIDGVVYYLHAKTTND